MSVTVKRVDGKRHCFFELIVETEDGMTVRVPFNGVELEDLEKADSAMLRAVKRFIQIVLLILLSPFVLFMLGLVLSIVLLDDFLNDDD